MRRILTDFQSKQRPSTRWRLAPSSRLSVGRPVERSPVPEQEFQNADDWMKAALGSATHDDAVRLLNQQFWCWGRDASRPEGNGLLAAGGMRLAPPAGWQAGSCYRWEDRRGRRVVLWGFGLFFGSDGLGGIFLRRGRFGPLSSVSAGWPDPCWRLDEFPETHCPVTADEQRRSLQLLGEALDWIRLYEERVLLDWGVAYRTACLNEWQAAGPAERIPQAWAALAQAIGELVGN